MRDAEVQLNENASIASNYIALHRKLCSACQSQAIYGLDRGIISGCPVNVNM